MRMDPPRSEGCRDGDGYSLNTISEPPRDRSQIIVGSALHGVVFCNKQCCFCAVTQRYMPQLDGLRAFAVFGVLIQHFLSFEMPGFLGVRLFFVLSGFLITGLLLDSRNLVESGLSTYGEQLKRFYARRMLRLYPPLLVFIAVCLALDLGRMR